MIKFVIYQKEGIYYKATLTEEQLKELHSNREITNIMSYPTQIIMESVYSNLTHTGGEKRKVIYG